MGSSNRQPYLLAPAMTQSFLDESATNLECRLELIADIQIPNGVMHVSDRNKYVVAPDGTGTFYQARTTFPTITRTLGDWLNDDVEFSTLTLEVSNVDGVFNPYLPGGISYDGFIQKTLTVSLGLAEVQSTYTPIFNGRVTSVAGVARSLKSVTFTARDLFDILNIQFPPATFQFASYPFIDSGLVNTVVPVIYGDWTVYTDPSPACIPALVVNSADMRSNSNLNLPIVISLANPAVFTSTSPVQLAAGTPIQLTTTGTLPGPLSTGTTYYAVNVTTYSFQVANSPGGSALSTAGSIQTGTQSYAAAANPAGYANLQCVIAYNSLKSFLPDQVYLKRGDLYYLVPAAYIQNVASDNTSFEVFQDPTNEWVVDSSGNASAYLFDSGDEFYVKVVGKDLGTHTNNCVWQAYDILTTYTVITPTQVNANWVSFRDKSTPPQSAISAIQSRVWVQDQTAALTYVKSMLEQVRLEIFIAADQTIKINSLHFEDWNAAPDFTFKQWDIEKDTLLPTLDIRNNFNRAQASYNLQPDSGNEILTTPFYRNQAAIDQSDTIPIGKIIVYSNLYRLEDVTYQLIETLKLASATFEIVAFNSTWRSILLDISDFASISVNVGGIVYDNVPCMIRSIGYQPDGLRLPFTVWSFQHVPFPGYEPNYPGTVGGYTASITQEE